MEYLGLVVPYPGNRALDSEELGTHLKPNEMSHDVYSGHRRLIRMSSVYIEIVDKFYKYVGVLSSIGVVLNFIWLYFWTGCVLEYCFLDAEQYLSKDPGGTLIFLIGFLFIGLVMTAFSWLLFRHELFRYTHYPMRFNRRNRMVYVFRTNGTVLSVPWGEVFFTLGLNDAQGGIASWEVRGHVLEADRKTVRETFALPYVAADPYEVQTMWEWVRRYMEGDPKPLYDGLDYCLPIDQKREPWLLGPKMILMETPPTVFYWALMVPVALMAWVGRRISLATCRIPVWPPDIEAACAIDPDDPYVKDGRTHPPDAGMWFPGGRQVD